MAEKIKLAHLYPKSDCMPCDATIRMSFFFDALGRNADRAECLSELAEQRATTLLDYLKQANDQGMPDPRATYHGDQPRHMFGGSQAESETSRSVCVMNR